MISCQRLYATLVGVAILGFGPWSNSHAAGFALIEQSVTALGNAFAGSGTSAETASAIFFNPAGLTLMPRKQSLVSGSTIAPIIKFKDNGSTTATGDALSGTNGGDAGAVAVVPNLYYANAFNDRMVLGLGVFAPFGLSTDYGTTWKGRYHATSSNLTSVNINPTFAYNINGPFSIGGGLDVQYFHAKLANAIDFGSICAANLPSSTCAAYNLVPQQSDGFAKIDGDDWGTGFNLGALYEPHPGVRLGLAYRSQIKHHLSGTARFDVPTNASVLAANGAFAATNASADVTTPETVLVSYSQRLRTPVTLLAEVAWTRWSRFKELAVEFANPDQPTSVQPEDWKDTFRYSLGATYAPSGVWTWRAGIALDQSPVPNATKRTPRIPDNDRMWLAVGANYQPSANLRLDVGLAHLFVGQSTIDSVESATQNHLIGKYDFSVNIASAQLVWNFN